MATSTAAANLAAPRESASDRSNHRAALSILTSLFFMWGFLTCLNDIMIPHLKAAFSLNYTQAMLVQFVFFLAYFLMSMPSGWLVKRIGYHRGIVIGLAGAGMGCLAFYPAADLRSYGLFLAAFFVLASGITLLQVAANPYVAVLGKPDTASSRLNLTQAFNSLGTTLAPDFGRFLIMAVAVLGADEIARMTPEELSAYQAAQAAAVQWPYVGLALVLFAIAIVFAFIRLPSVNPATGSTEDLPSSAVDDGRTSAWAYRHLVLGALAIFVYVGGEVAIGSFLVDYMAQPGIGGLSKADAAGFVRYYWGGAMIGRFVGALVMRYIPPAKLLGFNAVAAALLVVTTMFSSGEVAMWAILAVGLFNSIMFPTIFTLALRGLGRHTSQGSGILCAAIVGGALVPLLQGALADRIGIQLAFILPVLCYAYIAFYGLRGSRERASATALAVELSARTSDPTQA